MKKTFTSYCLVLFVVVFLANVSFAEHMGIITGGIKGTYYQFGLNLKELVKPSDIKLSVYNSNGSIENLYAVYRRPRTQMGIVQSDVLAFVSRVQTNPTLKSIASKTKMVFPLYNEEIHLLGRKGIENFNSLMDKKVAIGKEGSGTYLTAKLLFEVSAIRPKELIAVGTDNALSQLKKGEIDAMFYVAGFPVKLFKEDVTEKDGLALIPILNKNIFEFYPKSTIPAGTYNWQKNPVNTAAVKAVLVSFNFRRDNCEYVGNFAKILFESMDWLRENGHPKWKFVDLDFPLKGWDQYDCVKKYLANATRPPRRDTATEINPVLQAVKEILGK